MTDSKLTPTTARKLAELVALMRDWNAEAIATALWKVKDRPAWEVAAAAIRCADDPTMRTPAAIAWTDRPHWHPEDDAPAHQLRRPTPFDTRPGAPPDVVAHHRDRIRQAIHTPTTHPSQTQEKP